MSVPLLARIGRLPAELRTNSAPPHPRRFRALQAVKSEAIRVKSSCMVEGAQPYRDRSPRRSPYAAAWREYAWRVRCGTLLTAFWLLGLIGIAWRFRAWLVLVIVPAPLTGFCLRGFRCP